MASEHDGSVALALMRFVLDNQPPNEKPKGIDGMLALYAKCLAAVRSNRRGDDVSH